MYDLVLLSIEMVRRLENGADFINLFIHDPYIILDFVLRALRGSCWDGR